MATNFNSSDGFSTFIWGGPLWHVLRIISFNYPVAPTPEEKKWYKAFILSLGHVLPCGACRENYPKNLAVAGFFSHQGKIFQNRTNFSRFVYNLETSVHHMVTKERSLPQGFVERRAMYERFRAKCRPRSGGREAGCTAPLYSNPPMRALLRIVPRSEKRASFKVLRDTE